MNNSNLMLLMQRRPNWVIACLVLAGVCLMLSVKILMVGLAAVLPGDINSDNKVDVTDLSILLANYGQTASQSTNPAADINGNGVVDVTDLSALLSNYGKTNTSGTIISEDFSSPVSSFTPAGGTWAVSGGRYVLSESAPGPASVNAGLANKSVHSATVSGDFTLTADVQATQSDSPWDDAAVIFGYQDGANYYMALLAEGNDQYTHGLFKVQDGIKTELADFGAAVPAGTSVTVKVTRNGQSIHVYLNGALRASATDGTFGAGKAGFGAWDNTASFDNLVVIQGAPTNPPPPPSPTPTPTPTPGPSPTPGPGEIIWDGANLSAWGRQTFNDASWNSIQAVASPRRNAQSAIQFSTKNINGPGDNTVRAHLHGFTQSPGTTVFYSFSVFFPGNFPKLNGGWFSMVEWYGPPWGDVGPLHLGIDPASMNVKFSRYQKGVGHNYAKLYPLERDLWVDYVVEVRAAYDGSGYAQLWKKTASQTAWTDVTGGVGGPTLHPEMPGLRVLFHQYRTNNQVAGDVPVTYWGSSFRVAKTFAAAAAR